MKPTLYTPLVRIKSIQICYQLLQTRPTGEKRYQLLQTTHPPLHPSLRNVAKLIRRRRISLKRDNHLEPIPPQPTLNPSVCPVTTVERMDV